MIAVDGPLDVYSAPQLRRELLAALEQEIECLVVDLDRAEHLDSTGLGVLLSVLRRAGSQGCEMHLVCGDDRIRRAFDLTGLTRIFTIYRTEAELLGRLEAPATA